MRILEQLAAPAVRAGVHELTGLARSLAAMSGDLVRGPEFDVLHVNETAAAATGIIPVLAVHGYLSSQGDLATLAAHLHRHGHHQIYTYTAATAWTSVPQLAERLVRHVTDVLGRSHSDKVHLVGHSLGGIVIRYAVTYLGLDAVVDTAVTLGSPHKGTPFAATSKLLPRGLKQAPRP